MVVQFGQQLQGDATPLVFADGFDQQVGGHNLPRTQGIGTLDDDRDGKDRR
jgi:hypothetical protein